MVRWHLVGHGEDQRFDRERRARDGLRGRVVLLPDRVAAHGPDVAQIPGACVAVELDLDPRDVGEIHRAAQIREREVIRAGRWNDQFTTGSPESIADLDLQIGPRGRGRHAHLDAIVEAPSRQVDRRSGLVGEAGQAAARRERDAQHVVDDRPGVDVCLRGQSADDVGQDPDLTIGRQAMGRRRNRRDAGHVGAGGSHQVKRSCLEVVDHGLRSGGGDRRRERQGGKQKRRRAHADILSATGTQTRFCLGNRNPAGGAATKSSEPGCRGRPTDHGPRSHLLAAAEPIASGWGRGSDEPVDLEGALRSRQPRGSVTFTRERSSPLDMPMARTEEIHQLLDGVREGRREDWDRLFALVYDDLRGVAHLHLRSRHTGTLGTTAIVNEAYLRLAGRGPRPLNDRVHFMAIASRAMRSVLVDNARAKFAQKRGGGQAPRSLEENRVAELPRVEQVLELERALERLGRLNERLLRVVELRFFGGLSVPEAAVALGVGERTVERDWFKARAFLHRWLREDETAKEGGDERATNAGVVPRRSSISSSSCHGKRGAQASSPSPAGDAGLEADVLALLAEGETRRRPPRPAAGAALRRRLRRCDGTRFERAADDRPLSRLERARPWRNGRGLSRGAVRRRVRTPGRAQDRARRTRSARDRRTLPPRAADSRSPAPSEHRVALRRRCRG